MENPQSFKALLTSSWGTAVKMRRELPHPVKTLRYGELQNYLV